MGDKSPKANQKHKSQQQAKAKNAAVKKEHQASVGKEPMRDYSVKEVMEDPDWATNYDWYSDSDTEKAIEHNTFWALYWYPDTPVGSYSSNAYDLALIVEQALNVNKSEGFDYDLVHDFEVFIRKNLRNPTDGISLLFNDHKTCYQPTEDRVRKIDVKTWVNDEERHRVIATDRLWEIYQKDIQPLRGSTLASLFIP